MTIYCSSQKKEINLSSHLYINSSNRCCRTNIVARTLSFFYNTPPVLQQKVNTFEKIDSKNFFPEKIKHKEKKGIWSTLFILVSVTAITGIFIFSQQLWQIAQFFSTKVSIKTIAPPLSLPYQQQYYHKQKILMIDWLTVTWTRAKGKMRRRRRSRVRGEGGEWEGEEKTKKLIKQAVHNKCCEKAEKDFCITMAVSRSLQSFLLLPFPLLSPSLSSQVHPIPSPYTSIVCQKQHNRSPTCSIRYR